MSDFFLDLIGRVAVKEIGDKLAADATNSSSQLAFFLLSQLKALSDFLDYIKLDARSKRTQPNLARNSLFSFRGSLLFPK